MLKKDLFEIMQDNFTLASQLGLHSIESTFWSEKMSQKGDFINDSELWVNFRNNVITRYLDNANREVSDAKLRHMYRSFKELISAGDQQFLEEVSVGNPSTVLIDGRNISHSSVEFTYMLTHLTPFLAKSKVVAEIGAGYGGLARIVKSAFPSLKYILLDLPEANAIQTYFLNQNFPTLRFNYAREIYRMSLLNPDDLKFDFLILPGQFVTKLAPHSVDMFINTRSMMEMNSETVSFYFENIHKILKPGGAFYCLNRYRKGTRFKDYPFDDNWYACYSSPWPTFIDENPHHELIAVRTTFPVLGGVTDLLGVLPPRDPVRDPVAEKIEPLLSWQPRLVLNVEKKIYRFMRRCGLAFKNWITPSRASKHR